MSRTNRHLNPAQRIEKAEQGGFDWKDYPRWEGCQDLLKMANRKERYHARRELRKGDQPERLYPHKMVESLAWWAS